MWQYPLATALAAYAAIGVRHNMEFAGPSYEDEEFMEKLDRIIDGLEDAS